jgi:predicted acylesterase/phospholipase RssA
MTTRKPDLFRTYGIRSTVQKCTVVNSCLATSAATTFFDPITINGTTYIDGGFGHNNPSSVVLDELEGNDWLLPMQDAITGVGCFVSVGTGKPTYSRDEKTLLSYVTPKGVKSMQDAAAACIRIATNCHEAHLEIKKR